MSSDARDHAFRLARLSPSLGRTDEMISPELLQTMEAFPHAAAYVTNAAFGVLTANPIAAELIAPLQRRNSSILAAIFVDPIAREYYVNWDDVARAAVSALRLAGGSFRRCLRSRSWLSACTSAAKRSVTCGTTRESRGYQRRARQSAIPMSGCSS
jgi:MmyB-like transcription regulator ligand binding domain